MLWIHSKKTLFHITEFFHATKHAGFRSDCRYSVVNGNVYSLNWGAPDLQGNPAGDAPFDKTRGQLTRQLLQSKME
ncbi:MAG: hypothetical protein ACJAZ0_002284 [Halioglobus sp.]|jgi:hypothetical protein